VTCLNCCWATWGRTSYHKDRPLISGQLPSYTTVETRLRNSKESGVSPSRAEPKHPGCYAAINNSRQCCPATPVNTAIIQQGSEVRFPLSGWRFIRELECLGIPFVHSAKYLGVIFDKRVTWRLHIEMIEAKAFRTFIRVYFPNNAFISKKYSLMHW
jgi:hypothetical protein